MVNMITIEAAREIVANIQFTTESLNKLIREACNKGLIVNIELSNIYRKLNENYPDEIITTVVISPTEIAP